MGEAKLYFEDVHEGDEAPVFEHTLERTDLVRYAGASGDYNPMHHDEVKAQAAGQPSVFGHGMFSMGLLGTALTDYVGVGNLTHYQVRFARQTWPGEQAHDPGRREADPCRKRATLRRPRVQPHQPGWRGEGLGRCDGRAPERQRFEGR